MEEFEKVEELVKRTGVSFEDARSAIRACDGNIVMALDYLEKLGKLGKLNKDTFDAGSPSFTDGRSKLAEERMKAEEKCKKAIDGVKKPAGKIMKFMTKNNLEIKKGDETVTKVPVGAAALLCCVSAPIAASAAFVSMMCGYDYSLSGETNMDKANEVIDKVQNAASKVKDEYDKL